MAAAGAVPCPVIPGDVVRARVVPKPMRYPTGRCPVAKPGNVVGRTRRRSGTVPSRPARAPRLRRDRVRRAGGPGTLPERRPEGSRERPLPSRPAYPQRLRPRLRGERAGLGRTVAAAQPRRDRRPGSSGQARRGERGRGSRCPRGRRRGAPRRLRSGADQGRAPGWPYPFGAGQPKEPATRASRPRPRTAPAWRARIRAAARRSRCQRGQLGSQHGLGSGPRPGRHGGEREPRGQSRRRAGRSTPRPPGSPMPPTLLRPRSSPCYRRASLKPGPRGG